MSAAAAITNYAGFSIYGAAKSALESVSEALELELKPLGIRVTIVQPGPFRTAFVSRSLERGATSLPDYAPTSGAFANLLGRLDGRQPGDPTKAADAIIQAVQSPTPPLRLVLGKYAQHKSSKLLDLRRQELAAWEPVATATEF